MSSDIIKNLSKEAIIEFQTAFTNSRELFWDKQNNKLIHPGEFGGYRENIVRRFLSLFIPEKYAISSGFVITNQNHISTQCDIIIYDKENTPRIENNYRQKFYPIEITVGIGEVKSDINSSGELNKYLDKMARIKKFRELSKGQMPKTRFLEKAPYDPQKIAFDQIFTFIICNKFLFDFDEDTSIKYESDIEPRFRHNLILSINDGVVSYKTPSGKTKNMNIPVHIDTVLTYNYLKNDYGELPVHMIMFLSLLMFGIKATTVLNLDMGLYLNEELYNEIVW